MLKLVLPKRQLKRAVDRNRARRRVRAALDQIEPGWRQGLTGIIYLNQEALTLPFPELRTKVVFLLQKAKII